MDLPTKTHVLARSADADGVTTITLELSGDGAIRLVYVDAGSAAERLHGGAEYEAWAQVPADQTPALLIALLAEKYGDRMDALSDFRSFCEAHGIGHENGAWS